LNELSPIQYNNVMNHLVSQSVDKANGGVFR